MHTRLICTVLLLVATSDCLSQPTSATAASARQDEVRQKGAQVMPFALEKTVHVFDKTDSGGVQRVLVRGDAAEQLTMIRSHLQAIAKAFAERDFSKPTHIHGTDMPGLAEMQAAKVGELSVAYKELPEGAEIVYASHSPEMITAIHRWFEAQLRDHGKDATSDQPDAPRE
jgi:hypothetical protein